MRSDSTASQASKRRSGRLLSWLRPATLPQSQASGVEVSWGEGSARAVAERAAARQGLKVAFAVWLTLRILLSLWGATILSVVPPYSLMEAARVYPDMKLPGKDLYGYTIGVWNIYDVRHYITIAEQGYQADPNWLTAYFPGYPLLIKIVSPILLGDSLLAALLISSIAALVFFWYLYRLVEPQYGSAVATRAVILSAVFPTSFFLFMGYTEALLLAFIVTSFYYARAGKWWLAGLLAGGAVLTKQPGIFLIVPLAYMYWQQRADRGNILAYLKRADWAWLLLGPAAALAYTLYRYVYISAPIADIADVGGSQRMTVPGLPLWQALGMVRLDNPQLGYNLMDIGFTLLMVALVAGVVWKVRSGEYVIYSLLICLVNLSISMWTYIYRPEVNMPRRMLIIFPIFILLALVTSSKPLLRLAVAASFAIYLYLSALFMQWVFIS